MLGMTAWAGGRSRSGISRSRVSCNSRTCGGYHADTQMIRFFAYFDSIIGVVAICTAFAVGWFIDDARDLSRNESIILALVAAFGFASLIASHGLMRVQQHGFSFHRISALGWIAAACVAIVKTWGTSHITAVVIMAIPVAIPALASLRYFARPDVSDRFEALGPVDDSVNWPARLLLGADIVLILVVLGFVSPKPRFGVTNTPPSTDTAASFETATKLFHSDHSREAIPLFEDIVRQNPGHALAQARLGGAYCQVGRFKDALPHLERAIALDATDYQSRSNLGLAYEKMGKPELGIEPSRQAVKLQPTNPGVLTNLGWVLLQAKRGSEAVEVYEKAVRLNPQDANTHYYLGLAYLASGKPHMALSEEMNLRRLDASLSKQLAAEIAKTK